MSRVIVDASLGVKWMLREEYNDEATALLSRWQLQETDIIVPSWYACEVANVLYQRIRKGTLDLTVAKMTLVGILDDVTAVDIDMPTAALGLDLAAQFNLPAAYDAQYLALAERLACDLWTADEAFWRATRSAFTWVLWIGEVVL